MKEMSALNYCFPSRITKTKMDDYIKKYDLKDRELDKVLASLYKRGYTLPQPYMSQALRLCCFGGGEI